MEKSKGESAGSLKCFLRILDHFIKTFQISYVGRDDFWTMESTMFQHWVLHLL